MRSTLGWMGFAGAGTPWHHMAPHGPTPGRHPRPKIGAFRRYPWDGPRGTSMNGQQIITMITRMVLRKLVNKGINAGLNKATGGGAQGKQAQRALRQARRAARMGNRL